MEFGREDLVETLRQLAADISGLSETDNSSVNLALSTFCRAYIFDKYARTCGLTMGDYGRIAAEILKDDTAGKFDGANGQKGLELLLQFSCMKNGDVPGHIAPTQKGEVAIMYVLGEAMKE